MSRLTDIYGIMFVSSLMVGAVACASDSGSLLPEEPMPEQPAGLVVGVQAEGLSFADGDAVGLFAQYGETGAMVEVADNIRLEYAAGEWLPCEVLTWDGDAVQMSLYAYYPYSGSAANISDVAVELAADQSQEANFRRSDFRVGSVGGIKLGTESVDIALEPVVSIVIVEITAGDGVTSEELISADMTLKLNNIKNCGTVNLMTGAITAAGEAVSVVPYKEEPLRYSARVIPQNVEQCRFIEIEYGGSRVVVERSFSCLSGKTYICGLTINKNKNGINVGVGSWDRVDDDFGGIVN